MRDLRADWRLWSRAERVMASLFTVAMVIAIPVLPFLVVNY